MKVHDKDYLKKKILEGRFLPVSDELFSFYDQFENLIEPKNPDELAFLLCYKGETFFRIGEYEKALSRLTRAIRAPKSITFLQLDAIAYNTIGMIYTLFGYEVTAYDNFKHCEECCLKGNFDGILVACRLNIGFLYQQMQNFSQALSYYQSAYELIVNHDETEYHDLRILTLSYMGILYCKMEDFVSAEQIFNDLTSINDIENSFYFVAANVFYISYFHAKNDTKQLQSSLELILAHASVQVDFFEFFDFYHTVAVFLLEHDKKSEFQTLVDTFKRVNNHSSLSFLHHQIQELEFHFIRKYGSPEDYLEASCRFVEEQQEFQNIKNSVLLQSMEHVELIHKIRQDSIKSEEKSHMDSMTGLLNKYTIEFLIQEKIKKHSDQSLALLLIDMDYFQEINGKLGHLTGDSIIRDTSMIIQKFFSKDALCGRITGVEFLICVSNYLDRASILLQAELLRQEICRQMEKRNLPLPTDTSIGIAFSSPDCLDYASLLKKADDSLYRAKKSSRNKVIATD